MRSQSPSFEPPNPSSFSFEPPNRHDDDGGVAERFVGLSLVGASAGNLISFIVPAGSYFFLMPHEKWSAKRVGALVTLVAGIVLLPTCVAMVFIDT